METAGQGWDGWMAQEEGLTGGQPGGIVQHTTLIEILPNLTVMYKDPCQTDLAQTAVLYTRSK